MPIKTPHFSIEAFISGDQFSASTDQRRMRQIDSHLAFLADIIGEGVIGGWELSESSSLVLSVSTGWGIIDRFVTRTLGPYRRTLLDNNVSNVWMRRRPGVIGQVSAFSDIASVSHIDVTPPLIPAGLSSSLQTISTISLIWNESSEFDFNRYALYRSSNNIDYSKISDVFTNEYIDINLSDNTVYYYKISAIDDTGNESNKSVSCAISTLKDTSQPADPASVELTPSLGAIHLIWRAAPVGNIDHYKAEVTPVSATGIAIGPTLIRTTNGNIRYMTIPDLTNGQRYKVILKSVGTNGAESDGVSRVGTPDVFPGPKDVEQIIVSDKIGDSVISDVILVVEWIPDTDPYIDSPAISYEIQLKEFDGDGGTIVSEWIEVLDVFSKEFKILTYRNASGNIVNKPIEERTQYFVTVRAIDEHLIRSIGLKAVYNTRSFKLPNPPTQLIVEQRADQSLVVSWSNSDSIFQKNLFTFIISASSNPSNTEVIENQTDLGRATTYLVSSELIEAGTDYNFFLRTADEFGNESREQNTTFSIPNLIDIPRPPVPSQQIGVAGDRQSNLSWNKPNIEYVNGYRVYRSEEQVVYRSTDFVRLDTLTADTQVYSDYGINNETTYVYFVTTIDIYNQESPNPVDDGFFDYRLVTLTPNRTGDLSHPESIVAVEDNDETGVNITWDITGGVFDGYEIFRSFNNHYSFIKIGTVDLSVTFYHDDLSLTKNGTYYYLVRKFRNEADLFVTESSSVVVGGVFLGKVTTNNGTTVFDISDARNILNLDDPVREETRTRLAVHKHNFVTSIDDRRINLGDTLTIDNWQTSDFQQYFTETDISASTTFIVYINGEKPETIGIFYNLDIDQGRLTFEQRLAAGDRISSNDIFPFSAPPIIQVVFDNLTEVQDQLPKEKIEEISAQQTSVGLLLDGEIPEINHEGRIRELLVPIQEATIEIDDGFRFAPEKSDAKIGESLVWYDVILAAGENGDILVAGTSDGIYTSEDFGLTWTKRFETITPVLKLFFSPFNNFYFALTNRGVLASGGGTAGGFSIWNEIQGMENTKIARDITEDQAGSVFCSSDLGIYKLLKDIGRGSFFWQQTPIFGPRSTESYAILYDDLRHRVIISNELGIFETTNEGNRWDFSDEFPEQRPIYVFWKEGDYIYAATSHMVWRRGPNDAMFQRICDLNNVTMIRKLLVWKNRIYISTNIGLMISKPKNDIQSDTSIVFIPTFAQMNRISYVSPTTSLNIIDKKLFAGTEDRLFIAESHGRISLQSEIQLGVIPTVYVNGIEYKIGYRFTTSTDRLKKFICFDEKIPVGAIVTFANQYQKYKAKHNGWTDADFSSQVFVYCDGQRINDGSLVERPITAMGTLVLPFYTDRIAHKAGADAAFAKAVTAFAALLASEGEGASKIYTGFTKENVQASIYSVERFLSQIYPEARIVPELDENGQPIYKDTQGNIVAITAAGAVQSFIPFILPTFNVVLLSCKEGTNLVGSFGKYKDLYTGSGGPGSFGSELSDSSTSGSSGGSSSGSTSSGSGPSTGTGSTGTGSGESITLGGPKITPGGGR